MALVPLSIPPWSPSLPNFPSLPMFLPTPKFWRVALAKLPLGLLGSPPLGVCCSLHFWPLKLGFFSLHTCTGYYTPSLPRGPVNPIDYSPPGPAGPIKP